MRLTAQAAKSYVAHPLTGAFFSVSFHKLDVEPKQAEAIFSAAAAAAAALQNRSWRSVTCVRLNQREYPSNVL